jgi:hypothetical protein
LAQLGAQIGVTLAQSSVSTIQSSGNLPNGRGWLFFRRNDSLKLTMDFRMVLWLLLGLFEGLKTGATLGDLTAEFWKSLVQGYKTQKMVKTG